MILDYDLYLNYTLKFMMLVTAVMLVMLVMLVIDVMLMTTLDSIVFRSFCISGLLEAVSESSVIR